MAGEAAEVAALLPATVAVAATQYDNQVLQYSRVEERTVHCSTVQYSTLQFSTVQYSTVLTRTGWASPR